MGLRETRYTPFVTNAEALRGRNGSTVVLDLRKASRARTSNVAPQGDAHGSCPSESGVDREVRLEMPRAPHHGRQKQRQEWRRQFEFERLHGSRCDALVCTTVLGTNRGDENRHVGITPSSDGSYMRSFAESLQQFARRRKIASRSGELPLPDQRRHVDGIRTISARSGGRLQHMAQTCHDASASRSRSGLRVPLP
jgi:hypothetical protein